MKSAKQQAVLAFIGSLAAAGPALGAPAQFEAGLTLVGQTSDADAADSEAVASLDLITTVPMGAGAWTVYVEGNTTPEDGGVSAALPEANADAGSAVDRDGNGRLQVSELHYGVSAGGGQAVAGLLDVTAYLDTSAVANDEAGQFLGAGFVNNPTVAFPDYTLGGVYARPAAGRGFGWVAAVAGSNGLGDNPDASYSELVDLGEDGKGVFSALELQWQAGPTLLRLGGWWSTADHEALDGGGDDLDNRGVYLSTDWTEGPVGFNLRAGLARESVSEAADFVALALEYRAADGRLGLGWARTGASDDLGPGAEATQQAEFYLRMDFSPNLHLTPSVQWLLDSGLGSSPAGEDAVVGSLRLGLAY